MSFVSNFEHLNLFRISGFGFCALAYFCILSSGFISIFCFLSD